MTKILELIDKLGCLLFGHNKITKKANNKKELFCETCKTRLKNGRKF